MVHKLIQRKYYFLKINNNVVKSELQMKLLYINYYYKNNYPNNNIKEEFVFAFEAFGYHYCFIKWQL